MRSNSISLTFPQDFFKDYAKGKTCQVRISSEVHGMPCATDDTTVLGHFTMAGYKAMGSRQSSLPDLCGAWICSRCHDIVDGRVPSPDHTRNQIQLWHAEGVMRTLDALVKAGVLPNP